MPSPDFYLISYEQDEVRGFMAGIGAKIAIAGIEAKYNWGLVDLYNGYKSHYLQIGILLYLGGSGN